jgi:predicted MFS family arabinose efflux permease
VPGALAARYSGRLSDRHGPDTVNAIALASAGTAFVVFLLGGESLAALMIGCNLLGYGTTSAQIANQTRVFTGPAAIRARLNTVYIFSLFAGGAIGSAVGIAVFEAHGWTAMVYIGMAYLAVGALLLTGHTHAKHRRSVVPSTAPEVGAARPAPAVSERR